MSNFLQTIGNKLSELRSVSTKAREAVDGVHTSITGLRAGIAERRARLNEVERGMLSREDLETRVDTVVRERAQAWLRDYGAALLHDDRSIVRAAVVGHPQILHDENRLMTFPALCAADPTAASALVLAVVEQAGYQPGLPTSARVAEAKRLRQELAELEAAEERAIDEAADAGIVIAHRPEVVQRRADEQRQRELDEQRLAGHRQRQEIVNRTLERRHAHSEYLARNK